MTITVNGTPVIGSKIGGPAFFYSNAYATAYRADITSMGFVAAGTNNLSIGGLSFTRNIHGAGVLVIYEDGTVSSIELRDGVDTAFINFPEPRQTTVEQSFSFAAADVNRTANLALFVGSVEGSDLPGLRPNVIKVTVGGGPPQLFMDYLNSNDGKEWDSIMLPIDIPAGATTLKVQLISEDLENTGFLPASMVWVGAGLSVEIPQEECSGMIGDFVWDDVNCNGLQDTGEPGIPNVTVCLLTADGDSIECTVTDANGYYHFEGLCAGTYKVVVDAATLPKGFAPTASMIGSNRAIDSDGSPATVVLENDNDTDMTIDFGYCRFTETCGLTIGFWKTNAAKDLSLIRGHAQVRLNDYYALLGCVVDSFSGSFTDWSQWNITKPIGSTDLKWALHWLSYGAYKPGTGWNNPESSDPKVKARGQLISLMLTSCYKGDSYTNALIKIDDSVKTVAEWTADAIEFYNDGDYAKAHMIAVTLNETCARNPCSSCK
jgi:hypothetical protein